MEHIPVTVVRTQIGDQSGIIRQSAAFEIPSLFYPVADGSCGVQPARLSIRTLKDTVTAKGIQIHTRRLPTA